MTDCHPEGTLDRAATLATVTPPRPHRQGGKVWPGHPYPLGATYDGLGTSFAVFSEVAERVELCLFGANGRETRFDLPEVTGFVWHGYVPSIAPGQPGRSVSG